jgi:uncharacterized membrane protein
MSQNPVPASDVTDNDRLMAAISYPIPIVAIVILLVEEMKNRPFQKYHAVQAIAANILLWIVIAVAGAILTALTIGICGWLPSLLWLVTIYWALQAYKGLYFEIPWLTQFMKKQGWL